MGTIPSPANMDEAAEAVRAGLGYLAALDPAAAAGLRAGAAAAGAGAGPRAGDRGAGAGSWGRSPPGRATTRTACYGPKSWLINRLGVTKGAAAAYLAWARRAGAHPRVIAALAATQITGVRRPHHLRLDRPAPAGLPGLRRRDPGRGRAVRGQPGGPGPAGRGDLRPVPAAGPRRAGRRVRGPVGPAGDHLRGRRGPRRGPDPRVRRGGRRRCWTPCRLPRGRGTCGRTGSGTTTRWPRRCSGCWRPGCCPERAGQPVRAWVHMSLAELLALDGDGALLGQWVTAVRARWAGHRAAASVGGSDGAAWLDGDAAAAVACDALVSPVVTGDVDPGALDGLVRLCVELARLGPGTGPDGADPGDADREPAATAAGPVRVPGPGGARAGHHRQGRRAAVRPGRARVVPAPPAARRPAGRAQPPAGHRLQRHRPRRHPPRRHPARPALPVGRRLRPARRRLPGPPRPPQGQRRPHQRHRLHPPVLLPPPGRHPPLGLDPRPEPRRHHHRLEPRPHQGPAQPQPARPSRVTPPARCFRGSDWCCSRPGRSASGAFAALPLHGAEQVGEQDHQKHVQQVQVHVAGLHRPDRVGEPFDGPDDRAVQVPLEHGCHLGLVVHRA